MITKMAANDRYDDRYTFTTQELEQWGEKRSVNPHFGLSESNVVQFALFMVTRITARETVAQKVEAEI